MEQTVTFYSNPTCPYCETAREFLEDKGVSYEEIDVSRDEEAQQKMVKKTGRMAVPTMVIGDEVITGFDLEKLNRMLA